MNGIMVQSFFSIDGCPTATPRNRCRTENLKLIELAHKVLSMQTAAQSS